MRFPEIEQQSMPFHVCIRGATRILPLGRLERTKNRGYSWHHSEIMEESYMALSLLSDRTHDKIPTH